MATAEVILQADGTRLLDSTGIEVLDDGTGLNCNCGCGGNNGVCNCWIAWSAHWNCESSAWEFTNITPAVAPTATFGRCLTDADAAALGLVVHDWTPTTDPCVYTKTIKDTSCSCASICTPPDHGNPTSGAPPGCCGSDVCNCWGSWEAIWVCTGSTPHWTVNNIIPGGGGAAGLCLTDAAAAAAGLATHGWTVDPTNACRWTKTTKQDPCTCSTSCTPSDPGTPTPGEPPGCCSAPCECPCTSWPGVSGVYPCAGLTQRYCVKCHIEVLFYNEGDGLCDGTVLLTYSADVAFEVAASASSCKWFVDASTITTSNVVGAGDTVATDFFPGQSLQLDECEWQFEWDTVGSIVPGGASVKATGGLPPGSYTTSIGCSTDGGGQDEKFTISAITVTAGPCGVGAAPPAGGSTPPPPPAPAPAFDWKVEGPKLWAILHAHAAAYKGHALAEVMWLIGFTQQIACGECRVHWLAWTKANPPRLAECADYLQWTIDAHNAVNVRLGKPVWAANKQ